jgi:dihydrofolate reductase
MRKVVLYALLSADGVAESPDRYVFDWDEAMDANLARVIGTQDAVLLGRRTYDEWAPHWPTADVQPFADFINSVPKYVFTATEPDVPWPGTTVVETPAERFVRDLKPSPAPTSASTAASSWPVPCWPPTWSTSSSWSSHPPCWASAANCSPTATPPAA